MAGGESPSYIVKSFTITNVASGGIGGTTGLSNIVDMQGFAPVAISMPAAWTAAVITFRAGDKQIVDPNASAAMQAGPEPPFIGDPAGMQSVFDDAGTERTVIGTTSGGPTAGTRITLSSGDLLAARFLQLRSGTSGTAVQQGADRVVNVICKAFD